LIEGQAIGTERWHARGRQPGVALPIDRHTTGGTCSPDGAIERIRDVHVPGVVEGEDVQSRARALEGRDRDEVRRGSGERIHVQEFVAAEVDDEQTRCRMKSEIEEELRRARYGDLPEQFPVPTEHEELSRAARLPDVDWRHVQLAIAIQRAA